MSPHIPLAQIIEDLEAFLSQRRIDVPDNDPKLAASAMRMNASAGAVYDQFIGFLKFHEEQVAVIAEMTRDRDQK